jgi:CSLREA domain-containing protein
MKIFYRSTFILILLASTMALVRPAHAASTIVVNSLDDTNSALDHKCTLREAIINANLNSDLTSGDCAAGVGADTITFSVSGTIMLGSTLPSITDGLGLTIDGTGQTVAISGNNAVRIMTVNTNAVLVLNDLTIENGYNAGSIGGGIYSNGGTLTITNSTFYGNNADTGGGIVSNAGTLTITNSIFSGNSAYDGGAIAENGGGVTITSTTFSGNSGSAEGGGVFINSGTADIHNSIFSGNSAGGGAGVYISSGTLSIADSTFSNNSSQFGSGVYINGGTPSIADSTFSGNSASIDGAGIYVGGGTLSAVNSTFSGNSSQYGGGVYVYGGAASFVNSTFSGNSVSGNGTGIYNNLGTATLANTIVAHGTTGGNCGGAITNGGSNLDDGTSCGWGSASGSLSSTDPLLGVLTGSPAYFPLNAGSPAINTGNDAICAAAPVSNTSQNGITRPQGPHCDIGSYEAIVYYSLKVASKAAQDGWVLEKNKTSNTGGEINSAATTINLGDDAAKRQYRGILSFGTGAGLPDNAVITTVTLKFRKSAVVGGGDPLTIFKGFMVDIKDGTFGAAALQSGDYQAAASQTVGPFKPAPAGGWYSIDLSAASAFINKLTSGSGLTQIRLRFKLGNNNNAVANYLSLFSGNAPAAARPQLVITYYVP